VKDAGESVEVTQHVERYRGRGIHSYTCRPNPKVWDLTDGKPEKMGFSVQQALKIP
jgi:hypothetical protein